MIHVPFLKFLIRGGILAGVILGLAVGSSGQTAMPQAPSGITPVEGVAPCSPVAGVQKRVYDTDPGGQGAFVEFRLFDPEKGEGRVFLVIVADPQGDAKAYLELPGRGVMVLSMETLMARYAAPCDIVNHLTGSPA